jgi:hypothetical protein
MITTKPLSGQMAVNDGPYFFMTKKGLECKWIEYGNLRQELVNPANYDKLNKKFEIKASYHDLIETFSEKAEHSQNYKKVDSVAVISDMHGEYKSYLKLLKASQVIDDKLNWIYGTGHLVVIGDMFDRGNEVTEILWHLYGLEKQAALAGGMVHVLLGNHEIMVLGGDLRYIGEKYRYVEQATGMKYSDLYTSNSVLGKWLRNKPIVITINNIIFIHAGISREMMYKQLTFRYINMLFNTRIIGVPLETVCEDEETLFLVDANGPIWYRGYFNDKSITESTIDSILTYYGKKFIVVGHTPDTDIRSLFNGKVFGADAGIGMSMPGRILMFKDGFYLKCLVSGQRVKM